MNAAPTLTGAVLNALARLPKELGGGSPSLEVSQERGDVTLRDVVMGWGGGWGWALGLSNINSSMMKFRFVILNDVAYCQNPFLDVLSITAAGDPHLCHMSMDNCLYLIDPK